MVSLFTTAASSSATPNDARRAYYLTESAIRYALSRLRISNFSNSEIDALNNAGHTGSNDNYFYAVSPFAPLNLKHKFIAADDVGLSADDWLTDGPWAVRIEVTSPDLLLPNPNGRGNYLYTLKTWIQQCDDSNCSNITGTKFQDTRIKYETSDPDLEQTIELKGTEHADFNKLVFGFTGAIGAGESDPQHAVIGNFQLSFIR